MTAQPHSDVNSDDTNLESVAWMCVTKINTDDMDWSMWEKQMNAKHTLVVPVTHLFYERKVTIFRAPKHNFSKAYEEREIIPLIPSQVRDQLHVSTAFSTQKKITTV
jgi:hypothetical protein